MAEGLTKRYFEEILEVTGVGNQGADRLDEISSMPESEFGNLVKDLWSRVRGHYEKNTGQVLKWLRKYAEQPKAFPFGRLAPISSIAGEPADWFVKKTALYYGKVVIEDPLEKTLGLRDSYTTEALRMQIVGDLANLAILYPWVETGLVWSLPSVTRWEPLRGTISKFADDDFKDDEWASSRGALRDEDRRLEGEALIQDYERYIRETTPQRFIDRVGGLGDFALRGMLRGSSLQMASGFFGSALTDSSPTTDLKRPWRLFGLWSSKRAELLVQKGKLGQETWTKMREEAKAGRVWQGLEVKKLEALMKLSPEQIIKVRDDSGLSLKSFREELGEKVEKIEMEKLADEKEMGQLVSQVSEDLNKDARSVEKDLKNIRLKLGVSAALTPLSLSLGLLPFPLARLVGQLVGSASLVETIGYRLDMQRQKERSGYFLVRLGEEAEEQEVRRRRRDI